MTRASGSHTLASFTGNALLLPITALVAGSTMATAQSLPTVFVETDFNTLPNTARVLRLTDTNRDGDYDDVGERKYVFDYSAGPGTSPFAFDIDLLVRRDGVLLVSDHSNGRIRRAVDLNDDGDFDDPFEWLVYFDPAIAQPLISSGVDLVEDSQGGLWFVTNGHPTFGGFKSVGRFIDLNGDGDANDAGEVQLPWIPNTPATFPSLPIRAFVGADDAIYYQDESIASNATPGVYRLRDLNLDGDFQDAGEHTLFLSTAGLLPNSGSLYIRNTADGRWWISGMANSSYIACAFDADGDGQIGAGELDTTAIGGAWSRADLEAGFAGELFAYEYGGLQVSLARYEDRNGDGSIDPATERTLLWAPASGQGMKQFSVDPGSAVAPPANYCTAGASAGGCHPTLHSAGRPSALDPNGFVLTLAGADPLRPATIFYGLAATSLPWGTSSTLCVASPIQRTPPALTSAAPSCAASHALDWNQFRATWPAPLGAPFGIGQQLFAQGWTRDGGGAPKGVLSDAIRFELLP